MKDRMHTLGFDTAVNVEFIQRNADGIHLLPYLLSVQNLLLQGGIHTLCKEIK
ncbi:MAG: hypothetical protein PHD25_08365 [Bacteroidales bacterium]|nr:hypothetical protein [Bacteroidales bacterium]